MRDPEKRYQPTRRRRQEARRKGQITRSAELNSVAVLFVVLLLLIFTGHTLYQRLLHLVREAFILVGETPGSQSLPKVTGLAWEATIALLPILLVAAVAAVLSNVLQIGVLFTAYPLQPRADKINPVTGFQRIFSMRSLFELGKSLAKIAIVSGVSYIVIRGQFDKLRSAMAMEYAIFFGFMAHVVSRLFLWTCLTLVVLAVFDYFYQRRDHEKNIMMTYRELMDDLKHEEGDPYLRARVKSLQQSMSRQRMMAEVEEADVVITNPVHLAVALKYQPDTMQAPLVIAKGARRLAESIREMARKHRIPIVENPPLAQVIYRTVEVNQEIPEQLYEAIVEVFVYVHQLSQQRRSALAAVSG